MMAIALSAILVVHALIHALGFAKAFELAPATQLTIPISRPMGLIWLAASSLLLASSVALLAAPRWFWLLAIAAATVSQVAIVASWRDARFGTALNVLTVLAGVYGAVAWGPFGLRAEYEARVARNLPRLAQQPVLSDAELAPLPAAVQRYLRYVGVVGHPQVQGFRVRFQGRIRSGPNAPWMTFSGEQHNFVRPPKRFFSMQARMNGLPVEALHAYDESGARMRVKLLSLFPVVDAGGTDFTRTETVTLLNDLCIMAPAALIEPQIRWRELDARSVEATYSNGSHTVRAVLVFDESGALVNFWSDDRPALSADGKTFVPQRWSTPVGGYRSQGPFRLASRGEGRYGVATGEYAYIQFDDLVVSYD